MHNKKCGLANDAGDRVREVERGKEGWERR